jgi:hypothetical protein
VSARLRPRRLAHRGVVDAAGLVVDRRGSERVARARVLARWTAGTAVYALGGAYAVVFPSARRVLAGCCEGAPLVRCPGRDGAVSLASTAALSRAEVDALLEAGARGEHIVLVRAGAAEVVALSAGSLADPSAWIDLDDVDALDVTSLGAPPPVVVAAPDETLRAAPAALRPKDGAAMAEAMTRAIGEMVARGDLPAGAVNLSALDPGASTELARAAAPSSGLGATLRALWSALTSPRARVGAQSDAVRALPPAIAAPRVARADLDAAPPGWWSRLRTWLTRRVAQTPAQSVLGDAQARYLERMVAMFRAGDLEAALRHAVPLGGTLAPGAQPKPVTWSPPTARDALTIAMRPSTHSTGTGGGALHALLRTLYRDAVTALVAEGRIDEAAFTLAELMREPGEAVALLERHGRLALAAQLADTAGLAPALRARQWLLAGDAARALAVVRRHGAFDAALAKCADDPTLAPALRRLWARHLAAAGDFASAVKVGAGVPELDEEVEAWTDRVLTLGGAAGIRVLAQRLLQRPERFPEMRARVESLAAREGVEALADRAVFAKAAAEGPVNPAVSLAARMLARPQARDAARSGDPADLQTLRALVALARDAALGEDVPGWPTFARVALVSRPAAWKHTVAAGDTGPRAVHDAVPLRDGSVLLALGEAGASVRDRDGRERARVDDPTHRIVWSERGHAALLLGARGGSWRVARMDLAELTSALWGECTLDAFADDYDGDAWVVGQHGEVLALDATAPDLRALPGPGRTPRTDQARVRCVARDATGVAAVRALTVLERWRWSLPDWSLVEKPLEPMAYEALAVHPAGPTARRSGSGAVVLDRGKSQSLLEAPHPVGTSTDVTHLTAPWAVLVQRAPDAATVQLWSLAMGRPLAELRLEGATAARGRVHGEVLTVCDDRGRVITLDLRSGVVLRDLRA